MRSRSSRLFIVLVHLVGISTNLPGSNLFYSSYFSGSNSNGFGIVGVHPMTILLDSLELDAAGGLDQLLRSLDAAGYDVDLAVLGEPYWLQDDTDRKCLGPTGFSECGDATLWMLRRRSENNNKKGSKISKITSVGGILSRFLKRESSSSFSEQGDSGPSGYALQLIDLHSLQQESHMANDSDAYSSSSKRNSKRPRSQKRNQETIEQIIAEGECLIATKTESSPVGGRGSSKQNTHFEEEQDGLSSLKIGPCSSNEAWLWNIDGDGVLIWDETIGTKPKSNPRKRKVLLSAQKQIRGQSDPRRCVWRSNETVAMAGACSDSESLDNQKLIGFSLVQYQTTSALSPKLPRHSKVKHDTSMSGNSKTHDNEWSTPVPGNLVKSISSTSSSELSTHSPKQNTHGSDDEHEHIPRSVRTSQSHAASVPLMHPELKPASQLLFAESVIKKRVQVASQNAQRKTKSLDELQNRNSPQLGVGSSSGRMQPRKPSSKILHPTHLGEMSDSSDINDAPHRLRKIPVHPYIEASKGSGIWKDPQTELNYFTDLSDYLGHDRKETGRHTLMGVGQYTRTMLKIKVYGIAFYVAKRDVLADPEFKRFAYLSSEDLQKSQDFYNHLMQSPISPGRNGEAPCPVDRTLLLKLNMQLSTETLRSSLDADWKLLSPEHKEALIAASFEDRPANAKMLQIIESDENPSRCSCGQTAPEHYNADTSCCARGTELVFTWRKNGHMELRLDGRMVKTFEDPEIGKAILYEYFRPDIPMSVDARERFPDGFPFLLAPLAQLRGISSPVKPPNGSEDNLSKLGKNEKSSGNMFVSIGQTVGGPANDFFEWVHDNAMGGISNIAKAANVIIEGSNHMGEEFDKNRRFLWKQLLSLPDQSLNAFSTLTQIGKPQRKLDMINLNEFSSADDTEDTLSGSNILEDPSQHASIPISDEIGVIIPPTMNFTHMLFATTVHLYLMLLLIVSVPGSSTTKLIIKRSNHSSFDSETESYASGDSRQNSDSESEERGNSDYTSLRSSDLAGLEVALDNNSKRVNKDKKPKLINLAALTKHTNGNKSTRSPEETPLLETDNLKGDQPSRGMKKALSYFV